MTEKVRFSPSICVTHSCNLNCIYCYQKHDNSSRMDFETAKKILDYIFDNVPEGMEGIEINIIGGITFAGNKGKTIFITFCATTKDKRGAKQQRNDFQ